MKISIASVFMMVFLILGACAQDQSNDDLDGGLVDDPPYPITS